MTNVARRTWYEQTRGDAERLANKGISRGKDKCQRHEFNRNCVCFVAPCRLTFVPRSGLTCGPYLYRSLSTTR